jgi:flagellar protein FlgJ
MATTLNAVPNIFDGSNLAAIKRLTKQNDPTAIKAAAQQFEALFVQTMLKSMRDATPHDALIGSDQQRMYESLLDQQLSQVMATRAGGTGLAAMIEKQMKQKQPDLDVAPAGIAVSPAARSIPVALPASKAISVSAVQ